METWWPRCKGSFQPSPVPVAAGRDQQGGTSEAHLLLFVWRCLCARLLPCCQSIGWHNPCKRQGCLSMLDVVQFVSQTMFMSVLNIVEKYKWILYNQNLRGTVHFTVQIFLEDTKFEPLNFWWGRQSKFVEVIDVKRYFVLFHLIPFSLLLFSKTLI